MQPDDPKSLGPYEIMGRLGEGGQGVVYLGRLADSEPPAEYRAIKLLHLQLNGKDSKKARERFIREAQAAMRVARFCTAQVIDANVAGDRAYIVSEYVRGPSLQDLVFYEGPRTGETLDQLALDTASALAAIHEAGIIHRDFKPHNVLLGPEGPRVIDFGLARTLDAGTSLTSGAVGTPAYMAPEQLGSTSVGPAADVFAWGATMAYAATGRPPFGADSIPVVISRILHEEPRLGALDGPLRAIVAAALAKDAAERPGAQEIAQHLLLTPHLPYQPMMSSHVLFTGGPDTSAATITPGSPRTPDTRPGAASATSSPPASADPGREQPQGRSATREGTASTVPATSYQQSAPAAGSQHPPVPPLPDPRTDPARPDGGLAGLPRRAITLLRSAIGGEGDGRFSSGMAADGPAPGRRRANGAAAAGRHRANTKAKTPTWLLITLWATAVVTVTVASAIVINAVGGDDEGAGTSSPSPRPPSSRPGANANPAVPPEPAGQETRQPRRRGIYLGGVDPNGYCRALGRGNAVFRERWLCLRNPARGGVEIEFSMTQVCRWQYDRPNTRAVYIRDATGRGSWRCFI